MMYFLRSEFSLINIAPLIGQKEFNIQFEYSKMEVNKRGNNENFFLERIVRELDRNEEGSGEKWKEMWFDNRINIFEPQLELLLNKYLSPKSAKAKINNKKAKLTIIVEMQFLGLGITVMPFHFFKKLEMPFKDPAYAICNIKFVDNENKENVLAFIKIKDIYGHGASLYPDYDSRIKEIYAKIGRETGKLMRKKIL